MARWLITGAGGMLGQDLTAALRHAGESAVTMTRGGLDVTNETDVQAAIRRHKPEVVVNCAAWTAVDDAEEHEEEALRVNGYAVRHLAERCAEHGTRLIQVSTDYVFDGNGKQPYSEDVIPCPGSAYGRTKLVGEQAVLKILPAHGYVLRTAWLYGAHGPNFVRTMIRLEKTRATIEVVDDQYGQPTWTADVARQILALVRSPSARPGIYHATSSGQASWYELAREVFVLLGADPGRVRPVTTAQFPRPAPRPAYSVLRHDAWARAAISPISGWMDALAAAFPQLLAADLSLRASQLIRVNGAFGIDRQQPGPLRLRK